MIALSHSVTRKHEHIIRLEGICWNISREIKAWPVLVFQKSHLGDLDSFVRLKKFKTLSMKGSFDLCANVGIAIRDVHCNDNSLLLIIITTANQIAGIVHESIQPQNVLVLEEKFRIVINAADFGFATCFQSEDDLVSLPTSMPWSASEHHNGYFRPEQAKQMNIFSFAILCFWLFLAAKSSDSLPLPPNTILESGQLATFEAWKPEKNLLQLWKRENKLVE